MGGSEDAPLVILSHGGGQTRFSWSRSARALVDAGFAVLSYDHRGHGQSDWSANSEYSPLDYAADLGSILLDLRPGRPVALIGASLGGITSLLAASRRPHQVRALVLVDVSPRVNSLGADRIRGFMAARPHGFASVEEAADAISAYRSDQPRPKDLGGLAKNLRLSPSGRYHWHWDPKILDGMPAEARDQRSVLLGEACRGLEVPTLLVRGLLSDVVSDSEAEHLRSLLPHLEYVEVAAAGHMVVNDRNDAFLDSIVPFLNRTVSVQLARSSNPE
jgi:pimeloyl-ACP methyl ester carboxylesterase